MLSANEIRDVRFGTAMGGYKKDEVDVFLDKVESDYEQFERTLREMNNKIITLKEELEDAKNAQGNIQNVLISAQKFADQIVEEAKAKSAEIISSAQASIEKITEQEKELTDAFDKKAGERKNALQSDVEKIVINAQNKQNAIEDATQDCIERQQHLFNNLKAEIGAFKAEITAKYKEHLELLSSLPDCIADDPASVAAAIAQEYDVVPSVEEYTQNPQPINLPNVEEDEEFDEIKEETVLENEDKAEEISASAGFVINSEEFEDE